MGRDVSEPKQEHIQFTLLSYGNLQLWQEHGPVMVFGLNSSRGEKTMVSKIWNMLSVWFVFAIFWCYFKGNT